MIISNPPFHDGMQTNLKAVETLIRGALDICVSAANYALSLTLSCPSRIGWMRYSAIITCWCKTADW